MFKDLVRAPFRSDLIGAIETMSAIADKQGMVKPEQAVAWLLARQREGRFKKEELRWVAVIDHLRAQSAKVRVSDVAAFAEKHAVRLEIEILDDSAPGKETRFSRWATPYGRNHREVIFRIPVRMDGPPVAIQDVMAGKARLPQAIGPEVEDPHYKDMVNVVAHLRMAEHAANGRRILIIDEVQSGWAQAGRNTAFASDISAKRRRIAALLEEHEALRLSIEAEGRNPTPEETQRFEKINAEDGLLRAFVTRHGPGVPDGPFVTRTGDWVALVIRYVAAYAADQGFDAVAFASGHMQNERYALTEKVDRIEYEHDPDLGWKLDGFRGKATTGCIGVYRTPEELEAAVGKAIAARILAGHGLPHRNFNPETYNVRALEGADLEVGGEGMRRFYDDIVPQVASDALRPHGIDVGKVEVVIGETNRLWAKIARHGYSDRAPSEITQETLLAEHKLKPYWLTDRQWADIGKLKHVGPSNPTVRTLPGFDIPPTLKESLQEKGMPLFSIEPLWLSPSDEDDSSDGRIATPETIFAALAEHFGHRAVHALIDSGRLKLCKGPAEVPKHLRNPFATGAYDQETDTAYLICNRMLAATAAAKLLHEIGEHAGLRRMMGERGWAALKASIPRMLSSDPVLAATAEQVKICYPEFRGASDHELAASDRFAHEVLARAGEYAAFRKTSIWQAVATSIKTFMATTFGWQVVFDHRDVATMVEGSLLKVVKDAAQQRPETHHPHPLMRA